MEGHGETVLLALTGRTELPPSFSIVRVHRLVGVVVLHGADGSPAGAVCTGNQSGRQPSRRIIMAIEVQPSLSPHLCVDGAAAAIDFYVKAFDAVELGRVPGPDGAGARRAADQRVHGAAQRRLPRVQRRKSSTPAALGGTPVTIHLTVTDVDASSSRRSMPGPPWSPPSRTNSGVTVTASCGTRSATSGRWASRCARFRWRNSPRR